MPEELITVSCLILTAVYVIKKRIEGSANVNFLNELELQFYGKGVNLMEDITYSDTSSYAVFTFAGSPIPKLALSTPRLILREGECGNVRISLTLENLSEHDFNWIPDTSGIVSVSKTNEADTWIVTGLTEGETSVSVETKNEKKATAFIHVKVE